MGYLSDWNEAEAAFQAALEAHPDCTRDLECQAEDHVLDCRAYRRSRKATPEGVPLAAIDMTTGQPTTWREWL